MPWAQLVDLKTRVSKKITELCAKYKVHREQVVHLNIQLDQIRLKELNEVDLQLKTEEERMFKTLCQKDLYQHDVCLEKIKEAVPYLKKTLKLILEEEELQIDENIRILNKQNDHQILKNLEEIEDLKDQIVDTVGEKFA